MDDRWDSGHDEKEKKHNAKLEHRIQETAQRMERNKWRQAKDEWLNKKCVEIESMKDKSENKRRKHQRYVHQGGCVHKSQWWDTDIRKREK